MALSKFSKTDGEPQSRDKYPNDSSNSMQQDETNEPEMDNMTEEERLEYASLDRALEQINTCLDNLEQKNDHLYAQLKEILETSRAARTEIQALEDDTTRNPDI